MSAEETIRQGQIAVRKQKRAAAIIAGKDALRILITEAVYAKMKPLEEINTATLTLHLEQLISKQEEVKQLDEEIKELEY